MRTPRIKIQYVISTCISLMLFVIPYVASAQDYQPLTSIPGIPEGGGSSLADYINALFFLSIAIGGLLAVLKIAIGGFQYMMSDIVTTKDAARKDITGALLGLGILIAAVTILTTINRDLIKLDILGDANPVNIDGTIPGGSGAVRSYNVLNLDKDPSQAEIDAFKEYCSGTDRPYYGLAYDPNSDTNIAVCSETKPGPTQEDVDREDAEATKTGTWDLGPESACSPGTRWAGEQEGCVPE